MINWTNYQMTLGELEQYQNNPRTIKKEKFDKLKESLDTLGIFQPFVLDFDRKTILSGNMRQRALLQDFPKDYIVDCMVPDRELTLEEREKVIVMANGHHGEWDYSALSLFTIDINELDLDIKIPELEVEIPEFEETDDEEKAKDKKYILEVQLSNELELRDLYDDLVFKGFMVKEK